MGKTMAKMNENRRNGRKALKGFTLVEIIVVLVILAILAAAMIPALTGYIDKAKERTAIAEARNVLTAAQTLASEEYGLHGTTHLSNSTTSADGWLAYKPSGDAGKTMETKILELADIDTTSTNTYAKITALTFQNGKAKITGIKYVTSSGTTIEYKTVDGSSEFEVPETQPTPAKRNAVSATP